MNYVHLAILSEMYGEKKVIYSLPIKKSDGHWTERNAVFYSPQIQDVHVKISDMKIDHLSLQNAMYYFSIAIKIKC